MLGEWTPNRSTINLSTFYQWDTQHEVGEANTQQQPLRNVTFHAVDTHCGPVVIHSEWFLARFAFFQSSCPPVEGSGGQEPSGRNPICSSAQGGGRGAPAEPFNWPQQAARVHVSPWTWTDWPLEPSSLRDGSRFLLGEYCMWLISESGDAVEKVCCLLSKLTEIGSSRILLFPPKSLMWLWIPSSVD